MDAGFGCWAAHHADGLARAFAGSGVGLSALAANRQAAQVANTSIALDALQALKVHTDFAAQVAFDYVFAVLNGMNDLRELLLGQILGADARVNLGFCENIAGIARANPIDIP